VTQALARAGEWDRALAAAEAIGDARAGDRVKALSGVARALAGAGEQEKSTEVARRALAAAEVIGDAWAKAEALCAMAQPMAQAGQGLLGDAFTTARLAGRESVFNTLEHGATALAALDRGQTLWRIYEAVMEVESWWGVVGSR